MTCLPITAKQYHKALNHEDRFYRKMLKKYQHEMAGDMLMALQHEHNDTMTRITEMYYNGRATEHYSDGTVVT
jgi:hypothetical protein